jgi:hypothetical protein
MSWIGWRLREPGPEIDGLAIAGGHPQARRLRQLPLRRRADRRRNDLGLGQQLGGGERPHGFRRLADVKRPMLR